MAISRYIFNFISLEVSSLIKFSKILILFFLFLIVSKNIISSLKLGSIISFFSKSFKISFLFSSFYNFLFTSIGIIFIFSLFLKKLSFKYKSVLNEISFFTGNKHLIVWSYKGVKVSESVKNRD